MLGLADRPLGLQRTDHLLGIVCSIMTYQLRSRARRFNQGYYANIAPLNYDPDGYQQPQYHPNQGYQNQPQNQPQRQQNWPIVNQPQLNQPSCGNTPVIYNNGN